MAWKILKARTLPVGIDLGASSIKLAQLRTARGQLELLAAASLELPESAYADAAGRLDFLRQRLGPLLKSGGFQGRQCVLSLPANETFIQHLRLGKVALADLDKALRFELEGKLPFDAGDAVIRHVVAGETYGGEAGLEVIVLAAPREAVERHLEMARQCKLEVLALNVEPCAIMQCFARLFRRAEDARRVTLFLKLGQLATQVVIAHGSRLAFARNLMVAGEQMDEAAAAALKAPVEQIRAARRALAQVEQPNAAAEQMCQAMGEVLDALAGEVTKCLQYYESVFASSPVERVVFLGGLAMDRRLCQRLAQRMNLPAQIGDPLMRVARSPGPATAVVDGRQAQPAWAVAVGLGLGADPGWVEASAGADVPRKARGAA